MRIALVGPMGSGKTTAAKYLVDRYGLQRTGFADALKRMSAKIMIEVDRELRNTWAPNGPNFLADFLGMGEIPAINVWKATHPGVRKLLQVVGTDIGRAIYGKDVWVDKLIASLDPKGNYVVDDLRFPNEARALREAGFTIVRIDRPHIDRRAFAIQAYGDRADEAMDHPSESQQWDITADTIIPNASTVESLHRWLDKVVGDLDQSAPVE